MPRMRIIYILFAMGIISCTSNINTIKEEPDFSTKTFLNEIYNFAQSKELQVINDSMVKQLGKSDSIIYYHHITTELIDYIDSLRSQVINSTGGYSKNWHRYNGLDSTNTEQIITDILASHNNGQELQNKLRSYDKILRAKGIQQNILAPDGKEDPILRDPSFKENPCLLPNRFYKLHFNNADLLNTLIKLTHIRNSVLITEQRFLLMSIKPVEK